MKLLKILGIAILLSIPTNIDKNIDTFNKCDLLTKEFHYNREKGPIKLLYCIEINDGIKTLYYYQQNGSKWKN